MQNKLLNRTNLLCIECKNERAYKFELHKFSSFEILIISDRTLFSGQPCIYESIALIYKYMHIQTEYISYFWDILFIMNNCSVVEFLNFFAGNKQMACFIFYFGGLFFLFLNKIPCGDIFCVLASQIFSKMHFVALGKNS